MKTHNLIFGLIVALLAFAGSANADTVQLDENGRPIRVADSTPCATAAFNDALAQNADKLDAYNADDYAISLWLQNSLFSKDTIEKVLACPEVANADPDKLIKFETISHTFPNGREIKFNYSTTPHKLQQRGDMNAKRERFAADGNPEISTGNDADIWTNTDPGWYAIMAVRPGALRDMVGPDKNNTVGLDYIRANIDNLFPSACAADSALANDDNTFNKGVTKTVGMEQAGEKDTNDYYVAGDVDLRWITYAEVAADVALMIFTGGAWNAGKNAVKGARAARAMDKIDDAIDLARGTDKAKDYLMATKKSADLLDAIADANKTIDGLKTSLKALDNVPDAVRKLSPEQMKKIQVSMKNSERTADAVKKTANANEGQRAMKKARQAHSSAQQEVNRLKNQYGLSADDLKYLDRGEEAAKLQKELDTATDAVKVMQKEADDVAKAVKDLEKTPEVAHLNDLLKVRDELKTIQGNLRALREAKTGNIFARGRKWLKATWSSKTNKTINKAAKMGRSSMKSGKLRDWLFHSTMANLEAISTLGAKASAWYGVVKFVGGMYDYTETETGDFTNGVEFSPLLLVSADDIKGQENVVNHGMWFMWAGDSTVAADDDAAFLQAMDFAAKLHQTLDEGPSCPMDLYVVRPILRNPGTSDAAIYYLVMNDEPWSVD